MKARIASVLLCCALSACAGIPLRDDEGSEALAAVIAAAYRVSALPRQEQQAQFEAAWRAHAQDAGPQAALRLALLLSLPGTAFQDDGQAVRILEPYAGPGATTDLRRYATLLDRQLAERARLQRRALRLRERLAAPPPVVVVEDAQVRRVADLVTYAHSVSNLPPEGQRAELAGAERDLASEPSEQARVRLALLFSLPGTAMHDDARALELLAPFASGDAASPLQQFAVLLHRQVSERTRDKKRSSQLREQLEALRAIERSLIERRPKP